MSDNQSKQYEHVEIGDLVPIRIPMTCIYKPLLVITDEDMYPRKPLMSVYEFACDRAYRMKPSYAEIPLKMYTAPHYWWYKFTRKDIWGNISLMGRK